MAKSWDFGPSLMMEEVIKALEDEGCFPVGKCHPPRGETVPQPEVNEAVVFKDFFSCGLRIPRSISFAWCSRRLRYNFIISHRMEFLH